VIRFRAFFQSGEAEMTDRDDLVRERAYQIWQERGQPEGSAEDHWFEAEREMAGETDKTAKETRGDDASAKKK
jgi:Protein of unknown function (DUF2934)